MAAVRFPSTPKPNRNMISRTLTLLLYVSLVTSFQPRRQVQQQQRIIYHDHDHHHHETTTTTTTTTTLAAVIKSEEIDFDFDQGQGGVRLAQESVIKLSGVVEHKPGSAKAKLQNLQRYKSLTVFEPEKNKLPIIIITKGRGRTVFKDPGATTIQEVVTGPHDAVMDSTLNAAGSAMSYPRIVINFAGSGDLQVLDVLEAVQTMVLNLDVATKAQVSFNSVSDSSLPADYAYVTVLGLTELADGEDSIMDRGEVYCCDEKYFTTSEKDLVTDTA